MELAPKSKSLAGLGSFCLSGSRFPASNSKKSPYAGHSKFIHLHKKIIGIREWRFNKNRDLAHNITNFSRQQQPKYALARKLAKIIEATFR
jgi:hypothetical protein